MNNNDSKNHEEFGVFQIVILILSFVVLAALVVDTAFKLPVEISNVLQKIDTLICVVFLADFGIRFYKAKSKLAFLRWGWIDLIASILRRSGASVKTRSASSAVPNCGTLEDRNAKY